MEQSEPQILLRGHQYNKYCALAGLTTQAQQAQAFGQSEAYISRVRRGKREVNAQFIAGVLAAFPNMRFDDFFEVIGHQQVLKASA